ncbi:hypothetical protein LBMAG56_46000 [Verrucomicrobiota bacterium]|nr:hypothetical protein LBMAG56_46000 [Verrucomicrobiota bacterium]
MSEKTKILLVDDSAAYLRMLSANLNGLGFEVASVANPLDAPALARQFQPDVMLLDVVMPQQDGGDLYNTLRADPAFKKTPILFVTAACTEVTYNNGMIFIPKPLKLDVLSAEMQKALNARSRP